MNPSKSLMALFVAMCLAATAHAGGGAASRWATIAAGDHTFFIPKDKLKALKPGAVEALYSKKKPLTKDKSTVTRKKDGGLQVNLYDEKMQHAMPVDAKEVPTPSEKSVTQGAAPPKQYQIGPNPIQPRPASVKDNDLWNKVVSDMDIAAKPEQREAVALALEKFAAAHPDDYKRLMAAPDGALKGAISGVAEKLNKKEGADSINDFLVKAAPKADAGGAPPVQGKPVTDEKGGVKTVKDVVNLLHDLIPKSQPLRDRVAARLNEFIFDPNLKGDNAYVAAEVLAKDKEEARLKAMTPAWINGLKNDKGEEVSKPAEPGAVAVLYFVIGDDQDLPEGLTQKYEVLRTLKKSAAREEKDADGYSLLDALTVRMKAFTNDKAGQEKAVSKFDFKGQPPGSYNGQGQQIEKKTGDQSSLEDWWLGYYTKASEYAAKIYAGAPISKMSVKDIVDRIDEPITVPGVGGKDGVLVGGGSNAKRIMAEGFNFKDLYEDGAVTTWVKIPGQDGQGRRLSLKLYTTREGGKMVDKLGIFDITEPGNDTSAANIYGRRVALNKFGTSDIQLDDTRPDSLHYKVTISAGEKGQAKIKVTNTAEDDGIEVSTAKLYDLRRQQILEGPRVEVNGQQYYVGFQGAPKGMYTYYAADEDGKLIDSPRLQPSNVAVVSEVGGSGFPENKTGYQPLGNMGTDDNGKPVFYYVKWNEDVGDFEYKTCEQAKKADPKNDCTLPGDDVPTPAPAPKTGTGDTKPATGTGDTKPSTGTGDTKPTTPTGSGGEITDATSTGGLSKECSSNVTANLTSKFYESAAADGWNIFLNNGNEQNAKKKLNVFILCYSQTKTLMGQDLLLKREKVAPIREEGDNVIFETVGGASAHITADDLKKGKIDLGRSQFIYADGRTPEDLTNRKLYYVKKSDMLKGEGDNSTPQLTTIAWAVETMDMVKGDAKSIELHVPEVDADKAAAMVTDALSLGSASASSANKTDKERILKELKQDVTARQKALAKPLMVSVELYDQEVSQLKPASNVLTVGGRVILYYCHLPRKDNMSLPRGLYTDAEGSNKFCVVTP